MAKQKVEHSTTDNETGTFEVFRSSVKYLLVNEHGMPDAVAEEMLDLDCEYVQAAYAERAEHGGAGLLTEVAEALSMKPRKGVQWVRIEDMQGCVTLKLSEQVREYLDNLIRSGLYGGTLDEVAQSMLCRGIEGSFQFASMPARGANTAKQKNGY